MGDLISSSITIFETVCVLPKIIDLVLICIVVAVAV